MTRSVDALMSRGFDSQLSKKLVIEGNILKSLTSKSDKELAELGIPSHLIEVIKSQSRPPIPTKTLSEVLKINNWRCCVCKEVENGIVVHHIEEWHVSKDHSIKNLAVVCPNHHDKSHSIGTLSRNLTSERLRSCKLEWENEVKEANQLAAIPQPLVDRIIKKIDEKRENEPTFPIAIDYTSETIELINLEINRKLSVLIKSRFFIEFDTHSYSKKFGTNLVMGELAKGNNNIRYKALCWCSRVLSTSDEIDLAKKFLKEANLLGDGDNTGIAEAFILAKEDKIKCALSKLAAIQSPQSLSATLLIASRNNSSIEFSKWLSETGLTIQDFDSDGKFCLLHLQLKFSLWNGIDESLKFIKNEDFEDTPILYHAVAVAHLIQAVPEEYRSYVLGQLPLDNTPFELLSSPSALLSREKAELHFGNASHIANQLDFSKASDQYEEYVIWLQIMKEETYEKGIQRLREKLQNPQTLIRFTPLAIRMNIELDIPEIEKQVSQSIALNGSMTLELAYAKIALAYATDTPLSAANYIETNLKQLSEQFDKKYLYYQLIQLFAKAVKSQKAEYYFNLLAKEEISDDEKTRFEIIIAEAKGEDKIQMRKDLYRKAESHNDLTNLVHELELKQQWSDICNYGEILFNQTGSIKHAYLFTQALHKCSRTKKLIEFFESIPSLRSSSPDLQLMYCWALYDDGNLKLSLSELMQVENIDFSSNNYEELKINLHTSMGDWSALKTMCRNIYLDEKNRTAQQLIRISNLALDIDSDYTKLLISAAAKKGVNDAEILTAAFFLSFKANMEDQKEVQTWLQRATELSDENGPIQHGDLNQLIEMQPEWNERVSKISDQYSAANAPMCLVAKSVNDSLFGLTLQLALMNVKRNDPRRRNSILAFSGSRDIYEINFNSTIGLDATTLITLEYLGILELVLDEIKTPIIPYSTLLWLLDEKRKISVSQPSRIKDAELTQQLLAANIIEKLDINTTINNDLFELVGEELASLINTAQNEIESKTQQIVVRSYPMQNIRTFMDEVADLSDYYSIMCNCLPIVDKLWENGQISEEEFITAKNYLSIQEKPWPNPIEVQDEATLYLDGLSVTYFLHLNLLSKISNAGFKIIVSHKEISDANELITYKNTTEEIICSIKNIQSTLYSYISSGTLKIGNNNTIEHIKNRAYEHPTINMISMASTCESIISDDRFINQNLRITHNGNTGSVYSSLDLIDTLESQNKIANTKRFEYKTKLRRAGYVFVPVNDEEIFHHLSKARIRNNAVIESVDLRAIRENILQIKMNDILQPQNEIIWIKNTTLSLLSSIRMIWQADEHIESAITKSNWVLKQIDARNWVHFGTDEFASNSIIADYALSITYLLNPPQDISSSTRAKYMDWIEGTLLEPIKKYNPELFNLLIEWQKNQIAKAMTIRY